MTSPASVPQRSPQPPRHHRALIAGPLGRLVEWYDRFVYPSFALLFAGAYFPRGDPTARLVRTAAIFAAGLVTRTVGGRVPGRTADRRWRRIVRSLTLARAGGRTVPQPPPNRSELSLAGTPDSVARARRHAADVLRGWGAHGDTVDAARLIVSELATNAIRHADRRAAGSFSVVLEVVGDLVEISVWDSDPAPPVEREAGAEDTCGRGLSIVATTSARWGHHAAAPGPGKVVWAQLPLAVAGNPGEGSPAGVAALGEAWQEPQWAEGDLRKAL